MTFIALGRGNYFITINNSFLCRVHRARRLFSPSLEPEVAPNKPPAAGGKNTKTVGLTVKRTRQVFSFLFLLLLFFVSCACVFCVWTRSGQAGGLMVEQQQQQLP